MKVPLEEMREYHKVEFPDGMEFHFVIAAHGFSDRSKTIEVFPIVKITLYITEKNKIFFNWGENLILLGEQFSQYWENSIFQNIPTEIPTGETYYYKQAYITTEATWVRGFEEARKIIEKERKNYFDLQHARQLKIEKTFEGWAGVEVSLVPTRKRKVIL